MQEGKLSIPSRTTARATARASIGSDFPACRETRRACPVIAVGTRTTRSPRGDQRRPDLVEQPERQRSRPQTSEDTGHLRRRGPLRLTGSASIRRSLARQVPRAHRCQPRGDPSSALRRVIAGVAERGHDPPCADLVSALVWDPRVAPLVQLAVYRETVLRRVPPTATRATRRRSVALSAFVQRPLVRLAACRPSWLAWASIADIAVTFAARSSSDSSGQPPRRLCHPPAASCSCHARPMRR